MIFGNLPSLCTASNHSYIEPMVKMIPIIGRAYDNEEIEDPRDLTFKFIHGVSMELIGFIGLI